MFKSKTVFILGAGSSNEVGFPLGSDLKKTISQELTFKFDRPYGGPQTGDRLVCEALQRFAKVASNDQFARERELVELLFPAASKIARAMTQAPSIDNYLEAHADDKEIVLCGKLAIARAILIAEGQSLFRYDRNRPDSINHGDAAATWYGKLFQLLVTNVPKTSLDNLFQNVSFISFNYDRSLERYLPFAIDNYYHCGFDRACSLVKAVRILHPYGVCGDLPWQSSEGNVPYGGSDWSPELLAVADKIQTFSEQVTDKESLNRIKTEISTAHTLVFLGFGYHEMNMNLLTVGDSDVRRVFGTALGVSASDLGFVGKRIRQMVSGASIGVELKPDLKCTTLFDEYHFSLAA